MGATRNADFSCIQDSFYTDPHTPGQAGAVVRVQGHFPDGHEPLRVMESGIGERGAWEGAHRPGNTPGPTRDEFSHLCQAMTCR